MSFDKTQKYIHIPYNILGKKNLNPVSKMVYGFVQGFWEGDFRASNEHIAKVLGVSVRTVQRAIKELRDNELIITTNVMKDSVMVGRIIKIQKRKKKKQTKDEDDGWK